MPPCSVDDALACFQKEIQRLHKQTEELEEVISKLRQVGIRGS